MLESMRSYSKSFIIWIIFGILIAVFVIGFGTPGSGKLSCGESTKIGAVGETELKQGDFKYAFRLLMRERAPATMKAWVLDMLLRREILANEAKKMGFHPAVKPKDAAEDPDVVEMITDRKILVMGYERDLFAMGGWPRVRKADGKYKPAKDFNYKHFKKWTMWHMGLQVNAFMRQQQKELLAKEMADVIMSGVQVSEAEARAMYEERNHEITLHVAKFLPEKYKKGLSVTPAEIDKLLNDSQEAGRLETLHKTKYGDKKDLPDARFLRHVFVGFAKDAKTAEKSAAKMELRRLVRGATPETFASAARSGSKDKESRSEGGALGWKSATDLEDIYGKAFAEAVFKLEDGKISQPMESKKGWHVVLVEGRRKGTWSFEDAKRFLAAKRVAEKKARDRAKAAAEKKLASLKAGRPAKKVFFGAPTAPKKEAAPGQPIRASAKKNTSDAITVAATPPPFEVDTVSVTRIAQNIKGLEAIGGILPKVWALTETKPTLDEVLKLKGAQGLEAYVLIHRKSEQKPDPKAFEDQKTFLVSRYLRIKQMDTLNRWVRNRCEGLAKEGKIWIDKKFTKISYYPDGKRGPNAKPVTVKYKYCKQLPRHADPRRQAMAPNP